MSRCRGCGKDVIFARDDDGKWQVLDEKAPVWIISVVGEDKYGNLAYKAQRAGNSILVSHFSVCRMTDKFSGKNKDKK